MDTSQDATGHPNPAKLTPVERVLHQGASGLNVGESCQHTCRCQAISPDLVQLPMVSWYNLRQLFATGMQVALSTALGTRVDARDLEGLFDTSKSCEHEFQGEGGELWFDYASDVGDGFRTTYLIAHLLARSGISVTGKDTTHQLPRGRFLVLGGDEVYPAATRDFYRDRLLNPYQEAWDQVSGSRWKPGMSPRADVEIFAVPGNHDWYDGLVSFRRLFCQDPALKQRYVGDWKARQGRSYFAIKLPQRWWLWSVDVQLESDIDETQLRYFKARSLELQPGDRVILCSAEPDWVEEKEGGGIDHNLDILRREFISSRGALVYLNLAGDLHHYRHHVSESSPKRHTIIAGGGGAFLHPTHNSPGCKGSTTDPEGGLKIDHEHYRLSATFPEADDSFRLTWSAVAFPLQSPGFSVALGIVAATMAWGLPHHIDGEAIAPLRYLLDSPGRYLAEVSTLSWLIIGGYPLLGVALARSEAPQKRLFHVFGLLHGLVHVAVPLMLYYTYAGIGVALFGLEGTNNLWPGLARLVVFLVTCSGVSGLVVGLYFALSLNVFRQHGNEAFSAIASEQYKHFLRLHITAQGDLEVYPIGVKDPVDHPCDATPRLIEGPIHIHPDAA